MSELRADLEELLPVMQEQFTKGESFVIRPGGTSMLPTVRPGKDAVVLSALPQQLKKYDLPFYRRPDGSFVLHRIVEVGETYTCVGDGQFRLEPGVRREQMIALATAIIRGKREISVNSPLYRLYCKIWHHTRKVRHVIKWPKYYLRRSLSWLKSKL